MGIYSDKVEQIFFNAYIECALWSSIDEKTGEPMDKNYSINDFDRDDLKYLHDEAIQFFNENIDLINEAPENYNYENAGHDYWLTKNGHGAGFWDGDLTKVLGDKLTEKAENTAAIDLYIGDDNKVYYI